MDHDREADQHDYKYDPHGQQPDDKAKAEEYQVFSQDQRFLIHQESREQLTKQMSQMTLRRSFGEGAFSMTRALAFYEYSSPSEALDKLFTLFRDPDSFVVSYHADNEPEEAITWQEFNQLRLSLAKPAIDQSDWARAMQEMGKPRDGVVSKSEFKVLFGPPPFFGPANAQEMVQDVLAAAKYVDFAILLVDRFGVHPDEMTNSSSSPSAAWASSSSSPSCKSIGLHQLQQIQRLSYAESRSGHEEWSELCKQLGLPLHISCLDWKQFAQTFGCTVVRGEKKESPFAPHAGPPSVVFAVLIYERLAGILPDQDDCDFICKQTFTNLLNIQSIRLTDEQWQMVLTNSAKDFKYRQAGRRTSTGHRFLWSASLDEIVRDKSVKMNPKQPFMIVRNTEEGVTLIQIMFDEYGTTTRLQLQSAFNGRCVTVAAVEQEDPREMVHPHDIVASVNGETLIADSVACDEQEANRRVQRVQRLVDGGEARVITFYRLDTHYYEYHAQTKSIKVVFKPCHQIGGARRLLIKFPENKAWCALKTLKASCAGFNKLDARCNTSSQCIELSFTRNDKIQGDSEIAVCIEGLDCGALNATGPAVLKLEPSRADQRKVELHSDWQFCNRVAAMKSHDGKDLQINPIQPFDITCRLGVSEMTLGLDREAGCVVVTKVKSPSHAEQCGVRPNDVLLGIVVVSGNGVQRFNVVKPFVTNDSDMQAHLEHVTSIVDKCRLEEQSYLLQLMRLYATFRFDGNKMQLSLQCLTALRKNSVVVVRMPLNWSANAVVSARFVAPLDINSIEAIWEAHVNTLRLVCGECSVPEYTEVKIEICGIQLPFSSRGMVVFPAEVTCVNNATGDSEFRLYEDWYSFMFGNEGLSTSDLMGVFKCLNISPISFWDTIEYASELFSMLKEPDGEHLRFDGMNRLMAALNRDHLSTCQWSDLCRAAGAKPCFGLTRLEFVYSWNLELKMFNPKDVFIRFHTAEKLYDQVMSLFQSAEEQEDSATSTSQRTRTLDGETYRILTTMSCFDALIKQMGTQDLEFQSFRRLVSRDLVGNSPQINALGVLMNLYFCEKIFNRFSVRGILKRKNLALLWQTVPIETPSFTDELWGRICSFFGREECQGLQLSEFVQVYLGSILNGRNALFDWNRMDMNKLFSATAAKDSIGSSAALGEEPQRDELLQFSCKLDHLVERVPQRVHFESSFLTSARPRTKGFLHVSIKSITELRKRRRKGTSASQPQDNAHVHYANDIDQELYVKFEIGDESKLQLSIRDNTSKEAAHGLGSVNLQSNHHVENNELHDEGKSQQLVRELMKWESQREVLARKPPQQLTPKQLQQLEEASLNVSAIEKSLVPNQKGNGDSVRPMLSSVIPVQEQDEIIRFPDDHFRLYVDTTTELDEKKSTGLYLICRLYSRACAKQDQELRKKTLLAERLKQARATRGVLRDLVEKQETFLRHQVQHERIEVVILDQTSAISQHLSNLKQMQLELLQMSREISQLQNELNEADKHVPYTTESQETTGTANQVGDWDQHQEQIEAVIDQSMQATDQLQPKRFKLLPVRAKQDPHGRIRATNDSRLPDPVGKPTDQVALIGQTFLKLASLLPMLDEDHECIEDTARLQNEKTDDLGSVSLRIRYRCASFEEKDIQTSPNKLDHLLQLSLLGEHGQEQSDSRDDPPHPILEYPARSCLALTWKSNDLRIGDQMYLVHVSTHGNSEVPHLAIVWSGPMESPRWRVPEALLNRYGQRIRSEDLEQMNSSAHTGVLVFPSSTDLNLLPGLIQFCLVRVDHELTDPSKRSQTILWKSNLFGVLPDVNSVYSCFGSTPFLDIKRVAGKLEVVTKKEAEQRLQSLTLPNSAQKRCSNIDRIGDAVGENDRLRFEQMCCEQDLELAYQELRLTRQRLEGSTLRMQQQALAKIALLERSITQLRKKKLTVDEAAKRRGGGDPARSMPTKSDLTTSGLDRLGTRTFSRSAGGFDVVYKVQKHRNDMQTFRFCDHIIVWPEEALYVADCLRLSILGLLQSDDNGQLKRDLVQELQQVAQFYHKQKQLPSRLGLSRLLVETFEKTTKHLNSTTLSPAGALWTECRRIFDGAPRQAQHLFAFMVSKLHDEMWRRNLDSGLEAPIVAREYTMIGYEYEQLPVQAKRIEENDQVIHESVAGIPWHRRFRDGRFVATYVTKTCLNPTPQEVGDNRDGPFGEICRSKSFVVKPSFFDYSIAENVASMSQWALRNSAVQVLLKLSLHFGFAGARYLLSIVSLSFNISMLAANFHLEPDELETMIHNFEARIATLLGPIEIALSAIYDQISHGVSKIMTRVDILDIAGECVNGAAVYATVVALLAATFVVYVVVQEDLLLKVQQLDKLFGIESNKSLLNFLEQLGGLLVIPVYLAIKSCMLFIARQWIQVYNRLDRDPLVTLKHFSLVHEVTSNCTNSALVHVNYGFGIIGVVILVGFLFVCFPLLILDLYSWVPLSKLESSEELKRHAHSSDPMDIKAAIYSNASLVEGCCRPSGVRKQSRLQGFYEQYRTQSIGDLVQMHGVLGFLAMFVYMYWTLMIRSMGRALGALFGVRGRGAYMYKSRGGMTSARRSLVSGWWTFNLNWKAQFIKDKMIMPLVDIIMVTAGLWGRTQSHDFHIEERARWCYRMEPSNEIRQLQMMTLHGKIVSLFWLCVPNTAVMAYLCEVLNRGPALSYFINRDFLQAELPDTEREERPKWYVHSMTDKKDDELAIHLIDGTRFVTTLMKWGSSVVEIGTVLAAYWNPGQQHRYYLIALIAAAVTPVLDFNQYLVRIYMESRDEGDVFRSRVKQYFDKEFCLKSQGLNSDSLERGTDEATMTEITDVSEGSCLGDLKEIHHTNSRKDLVVLTANPQVSYLALTDIADRGEGEIVVNWRVDADQRFHTLDAVGMFPARSSSDASEVSMEDCICYRLVRESALEPFGWSDGASQESRNGAGTQETLRRRGRALSSKLEKKILKVGDESDQLSNASIHTPDSASAALQEILCSPMLQPTNKSINDILAESIHDNHHQLDREAHVGNAKLARKIVRGQVRFRPCNNKNPETDPLYESYVACNDAGIYPAKFGMHRYEFCYLQYKTQATTGLQRDRNAKTSSTRTSLTKPNTKVIPETDQSLRDPSKNYEILGRFKSNNISIGTFNTFMSLSSDRVLANTQETVNLSWVIYGVEYLMLSDPNHCNCIGFYKYQGPTKPLALCKVDIIPPAAYLKVHHAEADLHVVRGFHPVTTPPEPGLYEIRFLFNTLKHAQTRYECHEFGRLDTQMQQIRINSFVEKRAVFEAIHQFALVHEATLLARARMNARCWLRCWMLSALREVATNDSQLENVSDSLRSVMRVRSFQALESGSTILQGRLAKIVAPFQSRAFLGVLTTAFNSSTQLMDSLSFVTLESPTEEDEKLRELNPIRYNFLLPSDDKLTGGPSSFLGVALQYLSKKSQFGYHDLLDDLLLSDKRLMEQFTHVTVDTTSACVALFDQAITSAVQDVKQTAKDLQMEQLVNGLDDMLTSVSRHHLHLILRACLQTDCRTGKRCEHLFDRDRMAIMKKAKTVKNLQLIHPRELAQVLTSHDGPMLSHPTSATHHHDGGKAPITIEYIALRKWIRPHLVVTLMSNFQGRYLQLLDGTWSMARDLVQRWWPRQWSCETDSFPSFRTTTGVKSVLYFLQEKQHEDDQQHDFLSSKSLGQVDPVEITL